MTDIQTKRHLFIPPALSIARQKLQDYFGGYSEFYLKIDVYIFHELSRNHSRHSAHLWLSGTATCASTFNVLCNVQ
jgi:hypothetical protein